MHKKIFIVIAALVIASFVFAGCAAEEPTPPPTEEEPTGEPIKLGLMFPLTGVYSVEAGTQREGALLAVKELNAAGGVLGRPIEPLVRDTELSAETAMRRARSLAEVDKVVGICGVLHAGIVAAMGTWSNENHVPFIGCCVCSKAMFEKSGIQIYNRGSVGNNIFLWGNVGAEFCVDEMGWEKFYLFGADYAFGWDLCEAWYYGLEAKGATLLNEKGTFAPLGTAEFGPYIAKIKEANPDTVIVANFGADCVNFLKACKAYDLKANVMIASLTMSQARGAGPEATEGVYTMFPLYWEADMPAVKAFNEAYMDEYGWPPDVYSFYAYCAVKEMCRGIEGAGTTDAKASGEYLDANPDFEGPTGPQRWMPWRTLMRNVFISVGKPPAQVTGFDFFNVLEIKGYTEDESYMKIPPDIAAEIGW